MKRSFSRLGCTAVCIGLSLVLGCGCAVLPPASNKSASSAASVPTDASGNPLYDASRLEDGRFTLQVEDTDLQAELEDAIYSYRELFRQDGITLEYSADRAEYEELISGDPERLKQVFCNLLDNAAKHGGSGRRIAVHLTQRDGEYVITIRDFGPGIPEAELPYVKKKFYKGSSKARGSGIGLAVCDEIIQRHGGRLDVANAEGGGAVVTVYLPLKKQTDGELE